MGERAGVGGGAASERLGATARGGCKRRGGYLPSHECGDLFLLRGELVDLFIPFITCSIRKPRGGWRLEKLCSGLFFIRCTSARQPPVVDFRHTYRPENQVSYEPVNP